MAEKKIIQLPDIGGVVDAEVIEIFVRPGDQVALDDTLIAIEGDKATMEVPSTCSGVVDEVMISVGDKLKEGDAILGMSLGSVHAPVEPHVVDLGSEMSKNNDELVEKNMPSISKLSAYVPDIGGSKDVEVIELAVTVGDYVGVDDTLITLESDKATMDVPSAHSGTIESLSVQVGDRVSAGDLIAVINSSDESSKTNLTLSNQAVAVSDSSGVSRSTEVVESNKAKANTTADTTVSTKLYAGPAVRRLSRELNIDLAELTGSGNKGRITKEDLLKHVQSRINGVGASHSSFDFPAMPEVDFSQFGPTETVELLKIQKLSGRFLHRNWVQIPHVTQFGESDITELEAFRQQQKKVAAQRGVRLTALVFIMKAVVHSLKAFPRFNASLDGSGDRLVLKQYYHIGVAVDTPHGLVVPVIRDVDQKSLFELAEELSKISEKARTTGLSMQQMQGGCFTISSLGGIGGTAFTPIINAPEVAILGVSRSETKPIYENGQWLPRLMLPLSLSYDHRVIDGALGARFMVHLSSGLSDIRTLLL